MKKEKIINRNHNSFRVISIGFVILILTGALLLMLPISSQSRTVTPFKDTLFTAVSASCVTGLVVAHGHHLFLISSLLVLSIYIIPYYIYKFITCQYPKRCFADTKRCFADNYKTLFPKNRRNENFRKRVSKTNTKTYWVNISEIYLSLKDEMIIVEMMVKKSKRKALLFVVLLL